MSQVNETTPPSGKDIGEQASQWWDFYCHPHSNPGTRARLRRCRTMIEALAIPAALNLAQRLGALKERESGQDFLLTNALGLARVLAHVTENSAGHPMRVLGWSSFPGDRRDSDVENRPRLSEVRFRRLLQTGHGEEKVVAFTRLIALLSGTTDLSVLVRDYWYWNDTTKQRWAFEYYAAGIAAPSAALPTLPSSL